MGASYLGPFPLDGTGNDQMTVPLRTKNSSNVLVEADALPTYRIYSATGTATLMTGGTGSFAYRDTVSITGAANNGSGLIRITAASHGLQTGDRVKIVNVGGTTEANSTWTVTVISSSTFDLQGSTFSNAYTSGGTSRVLGLYYATISLTTANGYEKGKVYSLTATYASTSTFSEEFTFLVV